MKKVLLLLLVVAFLFSCQQRKVATTQEVEPPKEEVAVEKGEEELKPMVGEQVTETAKEAEVQLESIEGKAIHFDFDRYDIKDNDKQILKFVADWMTKKVFSVSPDSSISEAAKITREKGIKHLPVLKGKKVVGILSDRDIKEYVPSKATSLDVYELHYLLAKTKVKEIMKKKIYTTAQETPIEEAALVMHSRNIGCLPVIDDGRLVGIISDRDIFQVLVDITGIRHGGHRVSMLIEDSPGSIKDVADIIRKHGYKLQSVLTSYEKVKEGFRNIVIRMKGKGNFKEMKEELEGTYKGVKIRKG